MIVPVLHRILVKPDSVEESDELLKRARAVGIELQMDKREAAGVETGEVVALGNTAFKDFGVEGVISVGDEVIFAKYAGKQIKDRDGTQYLLLNDEDIVGIFKE